MLTNCEFKFNDKTNPCVESMFIVCIPIEIMLHNHKIRCRSIQWCWIAPFTTKIIIGSVFPVNISTKIRIQPWKWRTRWRVDLFWVLSFDRVWLSLSCLPVKMRCCWLGGCPLCCGSSPWCYWLCLKIWFWEYLSCLWGSSQRFACYCGDEELWRCKQRVRDLWHTQYIPRWRVDSFWML